MHDEERSGKDKVAEGTGCVNRGPYLYKRCACEACVLESRAMLRFLSKLFLESFSLGEHGIHRRTAISEIAYAFERTHPDSGVVEGLRELYRDNAWRWGYF